jgi:hypothetical protein
LGMTFLWRLGLRLTYPSIDGVLNLSSHWWPDWE